MTTPSYYPTKAQQGAIAELERALAKCSRAGVYLWDNYGTLSAVNGQVVNSVTTHPRVDTQPLDDDQVLELGQPACWNTSNSDDQLFVELKP